MRITGLGLFALAAVVFLIVGCSDTAYDNTTANRNANANATLNANTAPPTTANNNTNTRRAPTRDEYERDKDRYTREAKEAGRTIGSGINDGWLWTKVRFELAAADDLRDSTINVDVDNDIVTLTGTVASAAQKTRAEAVSKAVEGVKAIRNQLKVAAS